MDLQSSSQGVLKIRIEKKSKRKMGKMGWVCKRLFDQGMGVGELEGFPS